MVVPLPQSCEPVGPPRVGLPTLLYEVIGRAPACPSAWSTPRTRLLQIRIGPARRLAMGRYVVAVERDSGAHDQGRCAFAAPPGPRSV